MSDFTFTFHFHALAGPQPLSSLRRAGNRASRPGHRLSPKKSTGNTHASPQLTLLPSSARSPAGALSQPQSRSLQSSPAVWHQPWHTGLEDSSQLPSGLLQLFTKLQTAWRGPRALLRTPQPLTLSSQQGSHWPQETMCIQLLGSRDLPGDPVVKTPGF